MTAPPPANPTQRKRIRITLAVIVAVMALVLGLFFNKLFSPRVLSHQELLINGAVEFDKGRILSPFELVNEQGEAFTLEDLKGQWTLMFFGFATCPDICPTTLAKLSRMQDLLTDKIAAKTQVVMVTVDPARDTPEVLAQYIAHFDPQFQAVTGDFLAIKRLADNLNVAFNKVMTDDGYTVDHSGHIALINPLGHYHGILKPPFELARMKTAYQSIVTTFD